MNNNIDEDAEKLISKKEKMNNGSATSIHDSRRARQLWRRLAEVLRRRSVIENNGIVSTKRENSEKIYPSEIKLQPRYESFELIRWELAEIPNNFHESDDGKLNVWWRATLESHSKVKNSRLNMDESISLLVTFVAPSVNAGDLAGFDNTGNVRVWASEEVMAYWCIWYFLGSLREANHTGLTICELAGGMTCLSGLFLASALSAMRRNGDDWAFSGVERIILTDGNEKCVENARLLLGRNANAFLGAPRIEHRLLKFGQQIGNMKGRVDIILAADCLFFVDTHQIFVETLDFLLKSGGRAFLFAPERHGTLRQFVSFVSRAWSNRFKFRLVDLRENCLFNGILISGNCLESIGSNNGNGEDGVDFPRLLTLEKL